MIAKSLQNALSSVALMVALVLFSACGRQEVLTGDFSLVSPLPQMILAGGGEAPFVISSRTVVCYPEGDETLRTAAGLLAAGLEQATYLLRLRHMSDLYRSRGWNARER